MKSIRILAPIEVETTSGRKFPVKPGQLHAISQLQFLLTMLGEPAAIGELRGISAAKFQASAKAELERAFGEEGDGMVSDGVAAALVRACDRATINFEVGGKDLGPSMTWCFLPFMVAVAEARAVAPAAEPGPAAAPPVQASRATRGTRSSVKRVSHA